MKILPPLYQTHLENQQSSSQLLFFSLMINVLQDMKSVNLEKLSTNSTNTQFKLKKSEYLQAKSLVWYQLSDLD